MSIDTLNSLVEHCLENHPRDDAFASRKNGPYNNVSTEEFARRVEWLGLGLAGMGVVRGDRVAILSENRLEWAIADLSTMSISAVNVPVYSSLPPPQILHILKDSGAKIVIVSDSRQLQKIRAIREQLPEDLTLLSMEQENAVGGSVVITFGELYERGRLASRVDPELFSRLSKRARPGDLATIIYTSGTAGLPKGVMLSHNNIVSNILAVTERIPVSRSDSVLSFLPLSHILERMAGFYAIMYVGGRIAYASSIDTAGEDIKAASPTLVIAVPRFLEKMHERIRDRVSTAGPFRKGLFEWSLRVGMERVMRGKGRLTGAGTRSWRDLIAEQLAFGRLKKELGGRIRFFISGGAPLPLEIAQFCHAAGIPVYEGYGLTETSPVVSCNTPLECRIGSVGRPVPGISVKIAQDGEILVRGPGVMAGYLGMEKMTGEVIRDGWLHTGDIGRIDEDGFLFITDRKKDIIITSGGKNVAPQPIETSLRRSRYIHEVVLTGNRRRHISALIVPDFDRLKTVAPGDANDFFDQEALNRNRRIREIFEEEIRRLAGMLPSHEQVKKFRLIPREFGIDGGELTPTLKVRRSQVEQQYKDLIDEMYP